MASTGGRGQVPGRGSRADLSEQVLEGAPEVWKDLSNGQRRGGEPLSERRGG